MHLTREWNTKAFARCCASSRNSRGETSRKTPMTKRLQFRGTIPVLEMGIVGTRCNRVFTYNVRTITGDSVCVVRCTIRPVLVPVLLQYCTSLACGEPVANQGHPVPIDTHMRAQVMYFLGHVWCCTIFEMLGEKMANMFLLPAG